MTDVVYSRSEKVMWFIATLALAFVLLVNYGTVSQAKTLLTVMDWKLNETEATKKWFNFVKEKFEASHPGVEVRFETAPFEAYKQKVILSSAAKTGPDVVSLSVIWARELFETGAIMPLNKFIEDSPEVAPDKMFPATQVYNRKGNIVFGITNAMDFNCLLYDIDAFEEVGLPTDPYGIASWEAFLSATQKLIKVNSDKKVSRWGLVQGLWYNVFSCWLTANGGSFYNEDHTKAGFNTTAGIQTAEFLSRLLRSNVDGAYSGGDFTKGNAGMAFAGNFTLYFLADSGTGIRFNATSFPAGPSSKSRGSLLWGNMCSIMKSSKHPDLAWDYIKYYCSLEANLDMLKFMPYIASPRRDFYKSGAWRALESRFPWARMFEEIASVGGVYPYLRVDEMNAAVWPLLASAIRGDKPIESSFKEAERIYNTILAKKYATP